MHPRHGGACDDAFEPFGAAAQAVFALAGIALVARLRKLKNPFTKISESLSSDDDLRSVVRKLRLTVYRLDLLSSNSTSGAHIQNGPPNDYEREAMISSRAHKTIAHWAEFVRAAIITICSAKLEAIKQGNA